MSDKSTETTIYGGNPDNGCPPGGSDRGIADSMATASLQLGYGVDRSLATGSGGNGLGLSRLRISNKTLSARWHTWPHRQKQQQS